MNTKNIAPPSSFAAPVDQLAHAARIAGAVRFSQLVPENIRWLWPNRIPLGRITLLVSDPGLGKSLLTLDIAARVSTGRPWPDEAKGEGGVRKGEGSTARLSSGPPPSSVLLLTAEDDFADTVRPRLEVLGADLDRILGIATVPGDKPQDVPRAFALNRDLARLRNLLDAVPDCRLVVIDPISAYLGGTSEQSNADVQSLLLGLTAIARQRNVASHLPHHGQPRIRRRRPRRLGTLQRSGKRARTSLPPHKKQPRPHRDRLSVHDRIPQRNAANPLVL